MTMVFKWKMLDREMTPETMPCTHFYKDLVRMKLSLKDSFSCSESFVGNSRTMGGERWKSIRSRQRPLKALFSLLPISRQQANLKNSRDKYCCAVGQIIGTVVTNLLRSAFSSCNRRSA